MGNPGVKLEEEEHDIGCINICFTYQDGKHSFKVEGSTATVKPRDEGHSELQGNTLECQVDLVLK